jgi:hypothetical protein
METEMKTNVVPLNGPNWRSPDLALVGDTGPAPAFPVDVLAGWADWCRDTADAANAPQDYVAASLITTGAALIGNARRVSFGSWTEPSTIWTVLVGSPSAKKSPAMAPSKRAVGLLEAELVAQQPNSQPSPQLRIGDVTAQAAAEVVAANPRGVLLQLDEVSGWWAQTNRSGGEQFWLEAFGGNSYVVNRKGKKAHRIENLTISVLGTVQPDPLRDLLQAKTDRGFAARYLYVFPDPITGFRRPKFAPRHAIPNFFSTQSAAFRRRSPDCRRVAPSTPSMGKSFARSKFSSHLSTSSGGLPRCFGQLTSRWPAMTRRPQRSLTSFSD